MKVVAVVEPKCLIFMSVPPYCVISPSLHWSVPASPLMFSSPPSSMGQHAALCLRPLHCSPDDLCFPPADLTWPLLSSFRLATPVCVHTFTSRALWLARRQSTLACGRITSALTPRRTWAPGWRPWTRPHWCRTTPTGSGRPSHLKP